MANSRPNSSVVMTPDGQRIHGMDAEIFLKMEGKRDRVREAKILEWVELVVKEPIDKSDGWVSLKSGVILCKLINILKPGTIPKFSTTRLNVLVERENVQAFLRACWQLGMPNGCIFHTSDISTGRGMPQVYLCLDEVSKLSPRLGWTGPTVDTLMGQQPKIPQASDTAISTTPSKHWEFESQRSVHTDDLKSDNEKKNIDLQIQLADANGTIRKLKAENSTLQQEMKEYKKLSTRSVTQAAPTLFSNVTQAVPSLVSDVTQAISPLIYDQQSWLQRHTPNSLVLVSLYFIWKYCPKNYMHLLVKSYLGFFGFVVLQSKIKALLLRIIPSSFIPTLRKYYVSIKIPNLEYYYNQFFRTLLHLKTKNLPQRYKETITSIDALAILLSFIIGVLFFKYN